MQVGETGAIGVDAKNRPPSVETTVLRRSIERISGQDDTGHQVGAVAVGERSEQIGVAGRKAVNDGDRAAIGAHTKNNALGGAATIKRGAVQRIAREQQSGLRRRSVGPRSRPPMSMAYA